ncbi:MAG TPA: DUF2207 domain-containing protein [Actinomycetota bacterium]|nr:DUF2207 domain-containing protein [Actinomycetota bacterium]
MRPRALVRPTLRWLLPLALAMAVSAGPAAWAQGGERIRSYHVDLQVESSGALVVTERIEYDFDGTFRHGIFRDIPLRVTYDDRNDRVYPVDVLSVRGSPGTPVQYEVEHTNITRIKIGDPDRTISGVHVYTIVYRVRGTLNGFSDHDELYWNAVGTYWDVPIDQVRVSASIPGPITQVACFAGPLGSSLPCDRARSRGQAAAFVQAGLGPQEGVTVVVGFPRGLVPAPAPILKERWAFQRAFSATPVRLGLTGLVLLVLGGAIGRLVWVRGRDRRAVGSAVDAAFPEKGTPEQAVPLFEGTGVAVEYAPPEGVRPGQVGTLIDESANALDVTATVVDLAVRGYLRIEEIRKRWIFGKADWRLVQLKDPDDGLLTYEQLLLGGLFEDPEDDPPPPTPGRPSGLASVKLSSLRKAFVARLNKVEEALYADAMKRKWFSARPDKVRQSWQVRGWILFAVGDGLVWLLAAFTHWALVAVPVPLAGLFLVWGAKWMPRRTPKGTGMTRRILGFRTYMATAETEEAKFAERANLFYQYLPYAVVFGLTEKWAEAFAGLEEEVTESSWYVGSRGFNIGSFSSALDGFSTATAGIIASTPGSSGGSGFGGGGSSGGGGGGGGGGSW